jgi:hypothetical protein
MVGRNFAIDYRSNMYNVAQSQAGAAELLAPRPDVVLAVGTPPCSTGRAEVRFPDSR